ncbi:MAG TPA: metal-dependent hydrolase [Terriglobales bacterium]|nr:metal-dependent hydrolase [Terriglobales bacterium]
MNLQGSKLTWLGHATFRIETPAGKVVIIDPFLTGNPKCPPGEKSVKKVDILLCTHGHGDHIGDAFELIRQHQPLVIGMPELCGWFQKKGAQHVSGMNKGGTQTVGDVEVTMVHAHHSSSATHGEEFIYAGDPCGYVLRCGGGVRIYHAGDTNVFGDMAIIRELYAPDIALLPIGDHYTMSPKEAAYACKLLQPKTVVPMHFGTFPVLTGSPAELKRLVTGVEVMEMEPGVTVGA